MLSLNACDQLAKLARRYGAEELESAAKRAIEIRSLTIASVRSLLGTGRYRRQQRLERSGSLPFHTNVRGPDYYTETPPPSQISREESDDAN
ncbi:hypothetical protein [Pseudogulbenkiania subflava]|uniref:hypothetical protein n=1 Tax=Pseudogulbenkiania subflava TaxID=451637 RepID=UPI0013564163|nr:hypothetical protein [Pseudogulbenkiania subflava]